jgi:serine/threonine-protein kinase/endoribonuclease IRE1
LIGLCGYHSVAVFDVVQKQSPTRGGAHSDPFVLLQPRPSLEAGLANSHGNNDLDSLPNAEKAYVGLVEESGSLFAMSPARFPLVAFGGDVNDEYQYGWDGGRDGDGGVDGGDMGGMTSPLGVDAITARRKIRELCGGKGKGRGRRDRRCLLGKRPLIMESGRESWRSLLDGVPSVELPPMDGGSLQLPGVGNGNGNAAGDNTTWIRDGGGDGTLVKSGVGVGDLERSAAMYYGSTVLFVLASWGLLALFMGAVRVYKKVKSGGSRSVGGLGVGSKVGDGDVSDTLLPPIVEKVEHLIAPLPILGLVPRPSSSSPTSSASISDSYVFMEAEAEIPVEDVSSSNNNKIPSGKDIATANDTGAGVGAVQPTAGDDVGDAEDSERDGDGDGDVAAAGKRKGPKKKRRGKKKKAGAGSAAVGVNGGQGEEDGEKEENVPAEVNGVPPSPPSLVIPSTPQRTEPAMSSSLVVSDTILGWWNFILSLDV